MNNVATMTAKDRASLMQETAEHIQFSPSAVEKDFWVVWVLGRLFESELLSDKILFKGGTSLSKVFGLIKRFSEDIDLILDWNEVVTENPNLQRSNTKQDRFNKTTVHLSRQYIEETFLPEVQNLLGDICIAEIEDGMPDVINIRYPSSFESGYLRPEIRLEIGPLGMWTPNARYEISPYAAEAFPAVFDQPGCYVQAIKAERTFWEKATILHAEAFRPATKTLPARYSRHYYDLAMMAANAEIRQAALSELGLLESVTAFKAKFYPASWANYDLAMPGTFRLIPGRQTIADLERDYQQMQVMLFGEIPPFSQLMDTLQQLETEINAL